MHGFLEKRKYKEFEKVTHTHTHTHTQTARDNIINRANRLRYSTDIETT